MSTRDKNRLTWELIRHQVATKTENGGPLGYSYPRGDIPHPRDAGARPTATWPIGQIADYAIDGAPGEAPLAVREFPDRWEVFLDTAQVTRQVLSTVERDPTHAMCLGAVLVGGAIGSSVTNKREGVLLGAGLGLLAAALLVSALDDTPSARRRR